jgi:WS/DGAT/MGAT family acyltransferase
MQQMSGLDASFIYLETPEMPMHVASISIYDPSTAPGGRVTFKGILEYVQDRLHLARAFRQKAVQVPLGLDHPYWVEDGDFDLEYHIRHIALPKPGDWRQLCIQAARLHSRILDLSRPLWEMYVIEGLDNVEGIPKGSFALVQKTHHAAIDGVSGMEMMSAINEQSPDLAPPPGVDDWKPEREPTAWRMLSTATVNNTMRPMHFSRVLARTVPGLGRVQSQVRRRQLELPSIRAPRTRFNGSVSAHRVVEGRRFDLAKVRAAKASVEGATVNDAVLATVGGALRLYLQSKGELPDETMTAMAPISVRSEDQKGTAGNQVSGMLVSLGTDIADPKQRLVAVRDSTHQSKEFTKALGARTLTEYSQFIPGGLAALAARTSSRFGIANRGNPVVNAVVTNVPGPTEPLYFAGARLVTLLGMGPVGEGMGLIHPITSYCGELIIGATSCREMMPDPGFYADCIEESFDELVEATAAKPARPAKATKAAKVAKKKAPAKSAS